MWNSYVSPQIFASIHVCRRDFYSIVLFSFRKASQASILLSNSWVWFLLSSDSICLIHKNIFSLEFWYEGVFYKDFDLREFFLLLCLGNVYVATIRLELLSSSPIDPLTFPSPFLFSEIKTTSSAYISWFNPHWLKYF